MAVVLPDGSIFTLTPNLTWGATLTPILEAFPIANIQAPNFYSLSLPESLPKGTYTFYLVATPTNSNPLDSSLWLGSITTTINLSTTPTINQLYPTLASSATKVVVNGSGFTSLSKISLGTQTITPQFVSVTQLSFVVPFGLNQNGALIPFQAGEYPVKVDGSNPVNFTVIDLPDNPNPPGQLLASQVDSALQQLAVAVPEFQAKLPQLLSDQQHNPSAQKFIQNLADLTNYINSPSVQAALKTLSNQIDEKSLDTLERSLLPIQNTSNIAASTNSTIKEDVKATINTQQSLDTLEGSLLPIQNASNTAASTNSTIKIIANAAINTQQSSTNTSCYTLTNGDDWLACRNNIKVEIPDSGAPPVPEVLAARAGVTLGVPFELCEKAAEHWPPAIELAIACKLLGKVVSVPGILYDIDVAANGGTLRGFTVNVAGRDLTIDKFTNTPLSTNSTEVDINVHLNNYDNNQDLSKQTFRAKYIDGATLDISPSLNWVKISTKLAIDNADLEKLEKYTGKIPFLDGLIKKIINFAADKVNDEVNPPIKKLQISNANISAEALGLDADCDQSVYTYYFEDNSFRSDLAVQQNTDLKWLVKNKGSVAHLGQYIDTLFGCKYMIKWISRLPSEDDIYTKIQFSIKRYPQITVNVNGSGYITYEDLPLSGHQSCTHETSPCTEYFDLPPKPSLPADPNYTNVKLTAYNSDGTEAESTIWTGNKTDNCTGNASCLITLDPTNTAPPVITATIGSACEIGKPGPAGGIIFYCDNTGKHGLEAAPVDQGTATWGCWGLNASITIITSGAIGTGSANTAAIIVVCGRSSAAAIAAAYTLNGYSDWYLPSIVELYELYYNKDVVGGFSDYYYWSSTESPYNKGWAFSPHFGDGSGWISTGDEILRVRAVRAF